MHALEFLETLEPLVPAKRSLPCEVAEAGSFADRMAQAYFNQIEFCQMAYKESRQEAMDRQAEPIPDHYREKILNGPPSRVSWMGLVHLTDENPALAAQRWEEIRQAAKDELRTGHRAAMAVETWGGHPWERARFLAVRDGLAEQWHPSSGMEWQMIDQIAQAYTQGEKWQVVLSKRLTLECDTNDVHIDENNGKHVWFSPRQREADAIEQATAMVDRFNGIYLRTLRAMRDLRRYSNPIHIENAGQVNIAEKQVNFGQAGPNPDAE